ncbi:MAG: hypothetical protein GY862_07465 [Gammaproteobacteria bacterium]|nr:hypothetical protein [Gammaproteobacteria bacterium]
MRYVIIDWSNGSLNRGWRPGLLKSLTWAMLFLLCEITVDVHAEDNCHAGYNTSDGRLSIPFVNASAPVAGTAIYRVEMARISASEELLFSVTDLSLSANKPLCEVMPVYTYAANRLHIPFVDILNASGETASYQVDMTLASDTSPLQFSVTNAVPVASPATARRYTYRIVNTYPH